jgi:adenosylhomocysteinase
MTEGRHAAVPGDQRQRLGHQEQVRQPLRLPPLADRRHLNRATDVMLGGKVAVVSATATSARAARRRSRARAPRHRHRDRPDLRAAGGDGGLPGDDARGRVETADIFITATGNFNIITAEHMAKMKDKAIVGNIGHFDNEIDMAGLKKTKGIERSTSSRSTTSGVFPDGHSVLILAEAAC